MTTVQVSSPRPGVALITLDRPERLNAMSHELVADLHDAFNGVAADRGTRVVVLTGAGRGFCAGLDLKGAGTPPRAEGLGRIPAGIDLENRTQVMTSMTEDLREAVTAFVEKRPPRFGGR